MKRRETGEQDLFRAKIDQIFRAQGGRVNAGHRNREIKKIGPSHQMP